jgi:hypothetical protein
VTAVLLAELSVSCLSAHREPLCQHTERLGISLCADRVWQVSCQQSVSRLHTVLLSELLPLL